MGTTKQPPFLCGMHVSPDGECHTNATFMGGAARFMGVDRPCPRGDRPGLMAEQPGTTKALERDTPPPACPVLHLPYQLLSQREVSKSLDLLYVYLIIHL